MIKPRYNAAGRPSLGRPQYGKLRNRPRGRRSKETRGMRVDRALSNWRVVTSTVRSFYSCRREERRRSVEQVSGKWICACTSLFSSRFSLFSRRFSFGSRTKLNRDTLRVNVVRMKFLFEILVLIVQRVFFTSRFYHSRARKRTMK